jgi:lincosamide nucleotidyltransferase A/C/D/E
VGELEAVLAERGLERLHGAPPTSFYLVDPRGHQVDVHPVSFTKAGEAVYEMENGREWVYPAGAFRGRGRIAGRPVGCLAPEQLLVTHSTGYELDAVHRRDVERLCRRFGFPVPHFGTA